MIFPPPSLSLESVYFLSTPRDLLIFPITANCCSQCFAFVIKMQSGFPNWLTASPYNPPTLTPDLEATTVENRIPWLLGVCSVRGLMGLGAGSWRELAGHQGGMKRLLRESRACREGTWCLSSPWALWWVSGRVTGLWDDDDWWLLWPAQWGGGGLSWAFQTGKRRASLKAEWQGDEHAGDGLPRIICRSAGSGTAPSAATQMPPTSASPPKHPFSFPTHHVKPTQPLPWSCPCSEPMKCT